MNCRALKARYEQPGEACSERVLDGELQNARITCALDQAKRRRTQISPRVVEGRVVQQIEELKAQVDAVLFTNLENPGKVGIHREGAWALQAVVTRIAERTQRVQGKRGRIDPHQAVGVSYVRVSNHVRPV